jgi:hypothetical protein
MSMTVKTNNVPRPVIWGFELTEKEAREFDYLEDVGAAQFVRYRGWVYDLGEFTRIDMRRERLPAEFEGWHGYQSDSYFSGILIRYSQDFESVVVGTYYS